MTTEYGDGSEHPSSKGTQDQSVVMGIERRYQGKGQVDLGCLAKGRDVAKYW